VVQGWSLATIYKGMFQFMVLQVIAVLLLVAFPQIATWLPNRLNDLSRQQAIPEEYKKIIEQQRLTPSLEDDPYARALQKK
jgi:hypothetical protein